MLLGRLLIGEFYWKSSPHLIQSLWTRLMGYGGWLGKIPMHIPNDGKSFCDFREKMIVSEQALIESISQLTFTESNTAELDSKDE